MRLIIATLITTICFTSLSYGKTKDFKNKHVEKIVLTSGLQEQLLNQEEVIEGMFTMMNGQQKVDPAMSNIRKDLQNIWIKEFDANELLKKVKKDFHKNLNEKSLKRVSGFYDIELIKKVSNIEKLASTKEAQQAFMTWTKSLTPTPLNPKRVQAITNLYTSLSMFELNRDLVYRLFDGISKSFKDNSFNKDPEKKKAFLNAYYNQLNQYAVLFGYYVYQGLSDQEFNKYVSLTVNNSDIVKFYASSTKSVSDYYSEYVKRVATEAYTMIK